MSGCGLYAYWYVSLYRRNKDMSVEAGSSQDESTLDCTGSALGVPSALVG